MTPPTDTQVPDARGANGATGSNGNEPASRAPGRGELQPSQVDSCCSPSSARGAQGEERIGAAWLALLLPLVCCGGPLLIGALAATGAAALGLIGGVVAVVVVVAVGGTLVVIVRRRAGRRRRLIEGHQTGSQARDRPIGGALR